MGFSLDLNDLKNDLLSHNGLSRKSDVSQNTMRRLWHDPYRQVEISVLERIAITLEVPIGDLLEIVPDGDKEVL